ncbi:hypothetical protein HPP92_014538 [Vanilla planifolia]|uniref:Uncharacterized protein n=1 Tax=Vanilla planifolia TaxID=51239 RepID=A0A835QW10_VANPL|nr:hypothetical protein HPP92_014538 [Vanilla planifolia]
MEEELRKGTKRLALSYLCRFPELCHVILAARLVRNATRARGPSNPNPTVFLPLVRKKQRNWATPPLKPTFVLLPFSVAATETAKRSRAGSCGKSYATKEKTGARKIN